VASRPLGFQNMDQNVLEGFHFETAEEEWAGKENNVN
jgi:hypothetical protein